MDHEELYFEVKKFLDTNIPRNYLNLSISKVGSFKPYCSFLVPMEKGDGE